ncbi:hypothetical protein EDD86DRAFT_265602 [Gorgonomyces haynaldii]|nr:hypothetical protein EDD86DRAFT_265602 [Gorgonomyces haynaldii]
MTFSTKDIPDLSGKSYFVTGANTGIGFETTLELARKGAVVYLACRSQQRAQEAIDRIKKQVPEAKLEFVQLDLQDLKQVKQAGQDFVKSHSLDCLINNAGIMAGPFELTKDGIESQFQTNHVGHFVLTRELLPALLKAPEPRIMGINFDNINNEKAMSNWDRYGQSKLSNILFTHSLFDKHGSKILVNAVHPGWVNTELIRGPKAYYPKFMSPVLQLVTNLFALTPQQGALTTLYCATSPEIQKSNLNDKYFVPIAKMEPTTPLGQDRDLAQKLWDFTEKLVKEKLNE